MNRKSTLPIPEPIAQLQRQLDQFRSTQPRRTKLPDSLWQAAVELARQHGVYPVAHPLRLGWTIALQVREVNSGAARREARERLLEAARRREIDLVLVWRLDRWGRSVTDLLATLQELEHLGVGFVSLTEALDLTTPAGRAMAGLLAIFAEFEREILRERTRAGLAHARENGKRLGRPATAALHAAEIRKLHRAGVSKSEIARRLQIGRTSVRRILG